MKQLTFMFALLFLFAACETEEGYNEGATEFEEGVGVETTGAFGEWDADADAALAENEFMTGLGTEGEFRNWDRDATGFLDENEFGGGFYQTWDVNDDNVLDENEWMTAREQWFGDDWTYGEWSEWDADADAQLTEEEFNEGWGETDLFSEWDEDADAQLTEEEWGGGLYETWDRDANMALSEDEFNAWNPYWDWF